MGRTKAINEAFETGGNSKIRVACSGYVQTVKIPVFSLIVHLVLSTQSQYL